MKILTTLFILILLSLNIYAQSLLGETNTNTIIYVKGFGEAYGYVSQIGSDINTYQVPAGHCTSLSPNGRYLAESSENAQTLKIFYFPTMELIYQQSWNEIWEDCYFSWEGQDILGFYVVNLGLSNSPLFKFENLLLTEISLDTPEPVYPTLPDYNPDLVENFILQNPTNPDIYLYEICPSRSILDGELYCDYTDIVIYNVATQTQIKNLKGASGDYMRGYTVDIYNGGGTVSISEKLVSWSPDGRYLAYFSPSLSTIPHNGKLIVYDLQMDRYFEDVRELYLPNVNRNLQWSDNNILVIWRTGIFSDIYNYDYHRSLNLLTFLHADTEMYVTVNGKTLFDTWNPSVIFSPDGDTAAFIGKERVIPEQPPDFSGYSGDLILISTTTGEYTVMDTDVSKIITWRSICDFTPLDTASLISTMQSEPYSVICLAENGQYDLTEPLPDVAGDITIIGNGATINMTAPNRVFNVVYNDQWSRNGTLTLKDVTVSGGNATQGGAIYNAGELNLEGVTLENNSADEGGAIYNDGVLVITDSTLRNNTANLFGGAIYNIGTQMTLEGAIIEDNSAPEGSAVYQPETP